MVASLALAAVRCRSTEAREREAEARRLAHLVDQLRDAPNAAKAPLLEQLRQAGCESEDGCALKAKCVSAYERHLAALTASQRAKDLLASDAGPDSALLAAGELSQAESELAKARALTETCVAAQGELLRRVRAQ
jgi:hypothetical protein